MIISKLNREKRKSEVKNLNKSKSNQRGTLNNPSFSGFFHRSQMSTYHIGVHVFLTQTTSVKFVEAVIAHGHHPCHSDLSIYEDTRTSKRSLLGSYYSFKCLDGAEWVKSWFRNSSNKFLFFAELLRVKEENKNSHAHNFGLSTITSAGVTHQTEQLHRSQCVGAPTNHDDRGQFGLPLPLNEHAVIFNVKLTLTFDWLFVDFVTLTWKV